MSFWIKSLTKVFKDLDMKKSKMMNVLSVMKYMTLNIISQNVSMSATNQVVDI